MDNDSSRPLPEVAIKTHILQVGRNAEGHQLAYLGPKDSDFSFRIAGPKAWGDFKEYTSLEISGEDLIKYIKEYAPDIKQALLR